MKDEKIIKVIFVCTGNICRSPMAEAVFAQLVREHGLSNSFLIHSAGTHSYHLGERPHPGTRQVLKKNGIELDWRKRAERVDPETIGSYDYIIALDSSHAAALRSYHNVFLLLDFAAHTELLDVPDPYYDDNFDQVYDLVRAGCEGLLEHIMQHNMQHVIQQKKLSGETPVE